MKILVIGDSSVLPRKETPYDKTYTTLLKRNYKAAYIEVSAKYGATSKEININLESYMLYGFEPDIVILNYGIVDVFPRPLPNFFYKSCNGIMLYIDKFLKKTKLYYLLGNIFKFQQVKLTDFETNSFEIINKLLEKRTKRIIIISIIKPYKILLRNKHIDMEVKKYNKIFQKISNEYNNVYYIDMYNNATEDFTIWDGYHYSEKACKYIANKIKDIIDND